MKSKTKKLVLSALIAALTCVATLVIHVPLSLSGYVNLGDCIVLVGGWLLGPLYGFLAAGIGSALADVILGYGVYAPATFVIKGLTAVTAYTMFKPKKNSKKKLAAYVLSGAAAELVMTAGYCIFETLMYGYGTAFANAVMNIFQGIVCLISAVLLITVLNKTNATKRLK